MHKLTVGVLMGGKSIEREVSLNSGRTICDHLDTTRYNITPLFQTLTGELYILPWRFLHRGTIADFEHRLTFEAEKITWDQLKNVVDFIYIAQHGRFAEDGTMQGLLEILQIPYLGSKVFASALGMNKVMQKNFLQAAGIRVPQSISIQHYELDHYKNNSEILLQKLASVSISFPCIVKPQQEGSSLGISYVANSQDLMRALETACFATIHKPQAALIEEYISGMEFSCVILTDYKKNELLPLPITEIVLESQSNFFDYHQKYMPGRAIKYTPARCNREQQLLIQETCIKVMKTLNITNIARIDGFLTEDNEVIIIDPNTFSGMNPSSFVFLQAAEINMSHTALINHLIETELSHYQLSDLSMNVQKNSSKKVDTKKIRVAVLFGGRSNEKEISLESGRNVVYKLSPHKYEALPIFVTSKLELYKIDQKLLVRNRTDEIEAHLKDAVKIDWSEVAHFADFVFIALHGGEGENGCIQGALEMLNIPYNGSSVLTSALCINKYETNKLLKSQGIAVPDATLISLQQWTHKEIKLENFDDRLPLIIKPHDDGCSVLVHKVHNRRELKDSIEKIFAAHKTHVLIEEWIKGIELTVGVLGNTISQALPPSQAVAAQGVLSIEEKFLPGSGENQTPAPLPEETLQLVKQTVEQAYSIVGAKGYSRIDCFYQNAEQSPTKHERVVILEINTLPGLTPATCIFHQAAEIGIKPMDFIDKIIELGFEEHASTSQKNLVSKQISKTVQNNL